MREAFLAVNSALLVAVLVGLAVRGRLATSRAFPWYLLAGLLQRALILCWPGRFYVWSYWLALELLCMATALVLAVELLAGRVFSRLPAGRRRGLVMAALLLFAAFAATALAPSPSFDRTEAWVYAELTQLVVQARLAGAALLVGMIALAAFYRIPLDPLHRDIAAGYTLWVLVQACSAQLQPLDPVLGIGRQGFQRLIYVGVLVAWVHAAWRREPRSGLTPEALRILRPWRVAT